MRSALFIMILLAGCSTATEEHGLHGSNADGAKRTEMITLKYASAGEVHEALKALLGDPPTPPIAADQRTNSIIVMGSPEEIERVKEAILVMDRESPVMKKE